jgi:hypothetical protein
MDQPKERGIKIVSLDRLIRNTGLALKKVRKCGKEDRYGYQEFNEFASNGYNFEG